MVQASPMAPTASACLELEQARKELRQREELLNKAHCQLEAQTQAIGDKERRLWELEDSLATREPAISKREQASDVIMRRLQQLEDSLVEREVAVAKREQAQGREPRESDGGAHKQRLQELEELLAHHKRISEGVQRREELIVEQNTEIVEEKKRLRAKEKALEDREGKIEERQDDVYNQRRSLAEKELRHMEAFTEAKVLRPYVSHDPRSMPQMPQENRSMLTFDAKENKQNPRSLHKDLDDQQERNHQIRMQMKKQTEYEASVDPQVMQMQLPNNSLNTH